MSASSKVHLSSSASLYQLHIPSIYSSRLVQVFIVLKVQPSAFKWNRWLYSIVVRSWIVQVRLTSSLELLPMPNMDDFINITKLPLLLFFVYPKKRGHLWVIPRVAFIKCLNTWLKQVGLVSRRGCCFVFRAFFTLYISHFLPYFLLFHHCWSLERERERKRERARHFENFANVVLLTSLPSLP